MRVLRYFRSRRLLLAELESLRRENAELRQHVVTWQLISWVRRPPKAACPPESVLRTELRTSPHAVHPGRHREEALTEVHPRAVLRSGTE